MARETVTAGAPVALATGATDSIQGSGTAGVAFAPAAAGVVLLKTGDDAAPDMSDAARWDFGRGMLKYELPPGRTLYAQAVTGSVDIDTLEA